MGEALPLTHGDIAARRLAPKGIATFIHRAERLPDLLGAMRSRLGSLECLPLQPRTGREAKLILLRGRKTDAPPFACMRLCACMTAPRMKRMARITPLKFAQYCATGPRSIFQTSA